MAAYAAAVTSSMVAPMQMGPKLHFYAGRVDVTNYNQTLAAITAISGKFRKIYAVNAGVTDTGYILEWVSASNAFKAWTFEDTGNVPVQVASDVDVGAAYFQVWGLA